MYHYKLDHIKSYKPRGLTTAFTKIIDERIAEREAEDPPKSLSLDTKINLFVQFRNYFIKHHPNVGISDVNLAVPVSWLNTRLKRTNNTLSKRPTKTFNSDKFTELLSGPPANIDKHFIQLMAIYLASISGRRLSEIVYSKFTPTKTHLIYIPDKKLNPKPCSIKKLINVTPTKFITYLKEFRNAYATYKQDAINRSIAKQYEEGIPKKEIKIRSDKKIYDVFHNSVARRVTALNLSDDIDDKSETVHILRSLYAQWWIQHDEIAEVARPHYIKEILCHDKHGSSIRYNYQRFAPNTPNQDVIIDGTYCNPCERDYKNTRNLSSHLKTKKHLDNVEKFQ